MSLFPSQRFVVLAVSQVFDTFVERLFFPILLSPLLFVKNQLTVDVWVYLWTLSSVPLIFMSVLMSAPHSLDYCNCSFFFFLSFEIGNYEPSNLVLFQDCFGYFGSLEFPHQFQNQLVNFCKEAVILVGDCIDSVGPFWQCCHLSILSLVIREHGVVSLSFRTSLISFNILQFSAYVFVLLLLNLFLNILLFFDGIIEQVLI